MYGWINSYSGIIPIALPLYILVYNHTNSLVYNYINGIIHCRLLHQPTLCSNRLDLIIITITHGNNYQLSLLASHPHYCHHHSNHRGRGYSRIPAAVGYYRTCCHGICHRVYSHGQYRRLLQLVHSLHSPPLHLSSSPQTHTHHHTPSLLFLP